MHEIVGKVRGLYVLADTALLGARLEAAVAAALRGGARLVQYRDKSTDTTRRAREAAALCALCAKARAIFIVNDDPALAAAVDAHGVHLGRDDPDIAAARARLGPRAYIGATAYDDIERGQAALAAGADHVAFGRFFPSPTKPGGPLLDVDFLRRARAALDAPIVAIGGIRAENAAPLVRAGADALAVTSGVFAAADIEAAARALARLHEEPR
jgi:thiamine-phosphate pyrophosphorylase